MARVLHLTQEAVSRYEANKSMPTAANIAALAKLLDVSADYLLGLSEQDQLPKPLREQLAPQKWEMLCNFKLLSAKAKEHALGYLQGAAENK